MSSEERWLGSEREMLRTRVVTTAASWAPGEVKAVTSGLRWGTEVTGEGGRVGSSMDVKVVGIGTVNGSKDGFERLKKVESF